MSNRIKKIKFNINLCLNIYCYTIIGRIYYNNRNFFANISKNRIVQYFYKKKKNIQNIDLNNIFKNH